MAIDFTLTAQQRDLQLTSRKFAKEVLNEARAAELLPTPEQRFLATKPTYEAMVAAGYLRKCIPAPAGGDNAGLIDMAILAEEFYSVNPSVTLTMLGTILGLLPICSAALRTSASGCSGRFWRQSVRRLPASVPANRAVAPMLLRLRPARASVPRLGERATTG